MDKIVNMGNMNPQDFKIAMKLCEEDPEFKELWQNHHELKRRLRELEDRPYLTPEDEQEVKKIKRLKLSGKDKIAVKINEYKVGVGSSG